ncbi:inactive serine/threonine-protein kinase At1g67470 [Capsella rubella]|uniref:inactive serine/threonine-protein kinase At1g67470 n=1 Tax=Capsella rubella TaxID=81985 RepID=UPI000CD4B160|nr:inactive serine/threonine-protein kinase At1g67470 [Capsella rubella]
MGWLRNKKKKKRKPTKPVILANERGAKLLEELIECCDGKSNPINFFSADQILKVTNSFSESNYISRLAGYGCYHWTEWYSGETFVKVDNLAGATGYIDENYLRNGVVSEETDVFAIGMLMLKFLMGEKGGEDDDDNNSYRSAAMSEINDQRRQFSEETESEEEGEFYGEGDDDDDSATMLRPANLSYFRRFKSMAERRMDEFADLEMLEKMGEISKNELSQMKAFKMLSLRCIGCKRGIIPTMVEVAKELKKIQKFSS